MKIWAIGDLHLAFGNPDKSMEKLFPSWQGYVERVQEAWDSTVHEEDIVILPGDLSWAMRLEEARDDLLFLEKRPGTKVLVRGNHDYWWDTATKVRKALPKRVHIIHNDVFYQEGVAIAGARLWDSSEYSFSSIIHFQENLMKAAKKTAPPEEQEKVFERELLRLEMSLQMIPPEAKVKIAATHFPPIGLSLESTRASALLEKYGIQYALFGHLHSIREEVRSLFGKARGVEYTLVSADCLHFKPLLVLEIPMANSFNLSYVK